MKKVHEALYFGTVAHTRMRPVSHALRYRVFALLFDCDTLDALDKRLRLFSYNRFNLFSLYDSDHGDGTGLRAYLDSVAAGSGQADKVSRFVMLCYPRILGYAFNPVTVYFGLDEEDRICLVVYEVNNTFGERKSYVVPAQPDGNGLVWQQCPKEFFVSPFNKVAGTYSFHVTPIGDDLTLGVALKDDGGALLKAFFRGQREELTDTNLLWALARTGWMTAKVFIGIHYEAAKLWLKGLRTVPRPPRPETPISFIKAPDEHRS